MCALIGQIKYLTVWRLTTHIWVYRTANLQTLHFIYLFNKYRYWIFYTCSILSVFFSSKCSLFHNANLFGSCIIHILYTGCAKIKKNNSGAKVLNSECVLVALVVQNAKRMRRIITPVSCPALSCFSTLSHKQHDIRNKVTEHKICALIFYATFVRNISLSKTKSARYYQKGTLGGHAQYFYPCQVSTKLEIFSTDFQISSFFRYHENSSSGI